MPNDEIFDSLVRSAGDRAGVFECDGETAYFYLYDMEQEEGGRVLAAIQVLSGVPDFEADDVTIRWDATDSKVGLLIRGRVWAVFDLDNDRSYGGGYAVDGVPTIPDEISRAISAGLS